MMLKALSQLQAGNTEAAIGLVSEAVKHFESCHYTSIGKQTSKGSHEPVQVDELCYLPGLLFLYGAALLTNDYVALNRLLPTNLSSSFSRGISSPTVDMMGHCKAMLLLAKSVAPQPTHNEQNGEDEGTTTTTSLSEEWDSLVASCTYDGDFGSESQPTIPQGGEHNSDSQQQERRQTSWARMLFVALWKTFCLEVTSCLPIWMELSDSCPPGNLLRYSCLSLLGALYSCGRGGLAKDNNKAFQLFQRAADAEHARGTFNLGLCYSNGTGVDKDITQALQLWRRSADAGNPRAILKLAFCYQHGQGVCRDSSQSILLLQRAADGGDAGASCTLGVRYKNGDGVEVDVKRAVSLWVKASDSGDATAMNNLGVSYQTGSGIAEDICRGVSLYRRAAAAGSSEGMYNLAMCYKTGDGVDTDITQAIPLFSKAAEAGDPDAMVELGVCYYDGTGVHKNHRRAASLFQQATDAGETDAMYNLGLCYENGHGVGKDIHRAVSLYWRAADSGCVEAMAALGMCFQKGRGVTKDIRMAVALYKRAVEGEHEGAGERLNTLLKGCFP
ncbi:sel1 repeat family protein [Pelomyxa schiedti]|nr:sel1 repeat family protein [Pelomyxa schiedti]